MKKPNPMNSAHKLAPSARFWRLGVYRSWAFGSLKPTMSPGRLLEQRVTGVIPRWSSPVIVTSCNSSAMRSALS